MNYSFRKRLLVIALAVLLVLLIPTLLATAQRNTPAPTHASSVVQYKVLPSVQTADGYQMAAYPWRVIGVAQGGNYKLANPSGGEDCLCCKTFGPCIQLNSSGLRP